MTKQTNFLAAAGATILALVGTTAWAGPVGVDGSYGAEWAGVVPTHVAADPSPAPAYNPPSSPGLLSATVAYDVYYRADSTYLYGLLLSNGSTGGLDFANLYFNTDLVGGSDWGMEVTNNRAFVPGVSGYYDLTGYLTYQTAVTAAGTGIEWALSWSYFETNPQGILPAGTDVTKGIQLRTSQSFGYNGVTGDPVTRFGTLALPAAAATVPEPGSFALVALALGAAGWAGRRRRG